MGRFVKTLLFSLLLILTGTVLTLVWPEMKRYWKMTRM